MVQNVGVATGEIYNIGGGPNNTLSVWTELGPRLEEFVGHRIDVNYEDWRPGRPACVCQRHSQGGARPWLVSEGTRSPGPFANLFNGISESRELYRHLWSTDRKAS